MARRSIFFLSIFLVLYSGSMLRAQDHQRDPFAVDYDDHVTHVSPGETFQVPFDFKIPSKYYLYDEKTSILVNQAEGLVLLKTERPPPEDHFDPFLKKQTKVFFKDFRQTLYFMVPQNADLGRRTLGITLRYQGCSDDFCYRPVKRELLIPVQVDAEKAAIRGAEEPKPIPQIGPQETRVPERGFWDYIHEVNPEKLLEKGKIYLLGLAFVGGILTSFTPCVLPIIPLTLAFIGVKHRRRGNIFRAMMLVLGMVTMYSLLGFFAAFLGLKLGFLFQSKYFVLLTALFFLIFALGLFEVIPFHLPTKLHNRLVRMGGEGPWGAYLAGLTVGLIASPCVGPLIAPLLLIAARAQDRIYGFALLFNYGLGMGLIFLVLGSAYAELASKVKSGKWTHFLKRVLGVLMLAPALYYGHAFARPYLGSPKDALWVYKFEEGMKQAQESGKPLLVDFFANWCPPCLELDKRTFSTPEFRDMAQNFVLLKIDCSVDDANCQKATDQYEVVGWPTVLFLQSTGELIPDVKWVGGFADKDKMLELMKEAKEKSRE